jgi:anthranilate synthase component 2
MTNCVLLIDNYDSFVFNLARYLQEWGVKTVVSRNDAITIQQIRDLTPAGIVISPGPCDPDQAGISLQVIRELAGEIPILGVCLGHQAIGQAFGGKIIRAPHPVHGRVSLIEHVGDGLFQNLPNPLPVARYHSLVIDTESLPEDLVVTSRTIDGIIMSVSHRHRPVWGVQFHPESILTSSGRLLLKHFLTQCGFQDLAESPAEDLTLKLNWPTPDDFYQRDINFVTPCP